MAVINNPTNWKTTVYESIDTIDAVFTYTLEENETVVEFTIEPSEDLSQYGLVLEEDRLVGMVNDYFDGNVDMTIMYRDRKSLEIGSVNGFNLLPDPKTCDIFKFDPPSELKKVFSYTITLEYADNTNPQIPVKKKVTDTVSFTLYGSFDVFVRKLTKFVADSGNFPKLEI